MSDLAVGGKREATKAANRAAILDAAREVFADIGFGAASVRDIIRRTDLATGHVLQLLPRQGVDPRRDPRRDGGRDPRDRARRRAARRDDASRTSCAAGTRPTSATSPSDPLTLELLRRNAGTIRAMFDEPSVGAGTEELRDDLDAEIAAGLFPPHDTRLMASAMIGAGFEVGVRVLDRGEPDVDARGRPRDDDLRRRARAAAHALSRRRGGVRASRAGRPRGGS